MPVTEISVNEILLIRRWVRNVQGGMNYESFFTDGFIDTLMSHDVIHNQVDGKLGGVGFLHAPDSHGRARHSIVRSIA